MTMCPICGKRSCADTSTKHLLASFDTNYDGQGLHAAGMGGGALYGVSEIGDLLGAIRLARVVTWKNGGSSAQAPKWIQARPELSAYFRALGNGGFDLKDYQDLQEAADFIPGCTYKHGDGVRSLLASMLAQCGRSRIHTDEEDDESLAPTTWRNWWNEDANGRAEALTSMINGILAAR